MKTKLSLRLLLAGLLLPAFLAPALFAQEAEAVDPEVEPQSQPGEAAPAIVPVPEPAPVVPPAPRPAPVPPVTAVNPDTLTVDFPDEDVRNILRNVADLFELNLVIPDTLQGRTTLKLRDVTWRQIFQVVLSPLGFTYVEDANIIKVVSIDSLAAEPVTTEIFLINYARAEDLRPSLEPLVDAAVGGRVIVDARSNALVVTERPSRIGRIRPIIETLDRATDQVMIETKFVEVTDRDSKNIGINWSSLNGYGLGAGPFNRDYQRTRDSESNTGSQLTQTPIFDGNGNVIGLNTNVTPTNTSSFIAGTTRLDTAVFSADQFNVILSALRSTNDVKLVSNPTLVTLNNVEAEINIGEEFPIPNYTYNQERGTFEISGFEFRPIGVNLKVTPQVNSQGFIRLTVAPEVSSRAGETAFGGASGAAIPIIATRRTLTQVTMKDGFTMGIGGLIENTSITTETKVPVIGSVPGIGRLFRSDSTSSSMRNLIIFITARTVSAEGAAIEETFSSQAVRGLNLRRSDLPGYRDGSDPFLPELPVLEEPQEDTSSRSTARRNR